MSGPIDEAIAKTAPQPAPEPHRAKMNFANDRVGMIELPQDITPGEILGVITFIAGNLTLTIQAAQQGAAANVLVPQRPRLIVPN